MARAKNIQNWLRDERNKSYGALHLIGRAVYTYNVLLGVVDRTGRRAWVNERSYSVTSSGHRNRLLEALEYEGYEVTLTDGPPEIGSDFNG